VIIVLGGQVRIPAFIVLLNKGQEGGEGTRSARGGGAERAHELVERLDPVDEPRTDAAEMRQVCLGYPSAQFLRHI
jgi:hypothetical protein